MMKGYISDYPVDIGEFVLSLFDLDVYFNNTLHLELFHCISSLKRTILLLEEIFNHSGVHLILNIFQKFELELNKIFYLI